MYPYRHGEHQLVLEGEHYEVTVARTGEEGYFRANAKAFDLIVLDVMLPGRDGSEILATLRQHGMRTRSLILTAKDTIEDCKYGLDMSVWRIVGGLRTAKSARQEPHAQEKTARGCLNNADKHDTRILARQQIVCEYVIGKLSVFNILADRSRNRHRRFGVHVHVLATLYHLPLLSLTVARGLMHRRPPSHFCNGISILAYAKAVM